MRKRLARLFLILLTACGGGGDSGSSQIGNGAAGAGSQVPVITAINGSQILVPGQTAVVQVQVQYASAASELSYQWAQTGGPMLVLSGADTATVSFTVPAVIEVSTVTLIVDVTGKGGTVRGTWSGQILPTL